MVSQILKQKGITSLFDSSKIPGEILDLTVIRTEVLNRPDGAGKRFAQALAGAWYETMAQMSAAGPAADKALTAIAQGSQGLAGFVQGTAQHHKDVLHTSVGPRFRKLRGAETEDGAGAAILFRSRIARQEYEIGGRCRDRLSGRLRARQSGPRPIAIRLDLHADGRAGKTLMAAFSLIHAKPGRMTTATLSWCLFAAGIAFYLYIANVRHRENPEDRVTPTFAQMAHGIYTAASTSADGEALEGSFAQRFFNSMLWKDTTATARRFGYAMALLIPAVFLGLHMGCSLTSARFSCVSCCSSTRSLRSRCSRFSSSRSASTSCRNHADRGRA
jgi:hypothetical protein